MIPNNTGVLFNETATDVNKRFADEFVGADVKAEVEDRSEIVDRSVGKAELVDRSVGKAEVVDRSVVKAEVVD